MFCYISITGANQNSRLGTYKITNLILKSMHRINDLQSTFLVIERLRFTFTPNEKSQFQVENFSEKKISRQKLSRTTWSRGTNSRLPFPVNVNVNLSIICIFSSTSCCFSPGITLKIVAFQPEVSFLCCCVHSQKRKLAVLFAPSVTPLSTLL